MTHEIEQPRYDPLHRESDLVRVSTTVLENRRANSDPLEIPMFMGWHVRNGINDGDSLMETWNGYKRRGLSSLNKTSDHSLSLSYYNSNSSLLLPN